jgi:hypothetical protein
VPHDHRNFSSARLPELRVLAVSMSAGVIEGQ